jgi:hypothetical protein
MPCDSQLAPGQTLAARMSEIDRALKRLETALTSSAVRITIGPTGSIAFTGWGAADRDRVSDTCAYRALMAQGSSALRMAVARAETMSGKKVNANAVAAGHHSHDGGGSWHRGH